MNDKEKWRALLAPYRHSSKGAQMGEDSRGAFVIDQDRILFSSSFRRLSKKTQVHPLNRNDHIHTRLTHSLEVACVGRTLGLQVGQFLEENKSMPDNLVPHDIGSLLYAACLAHDVGNPPFGHAGESAIRDWFAAPEHTKYLHELSHIEKLDFQCFDGNAQGFRVVTALENNKDNGGFRLTFPTIASFVKYPNSSIEAATKGKVKFNFYQTEQEHFNEVFSTLGLQKQNGKYVRHPLAYLSEAADDICYRIIDIEDAYELKILKYSDILQILSPVLSELNILEGKLQSMDSDRRRVSMLRTLVINKMIKSSFVSFKQNYDRIMDGEQFNIIDTCDDAAKEYMKNAKDAFYDIIAKEPKKLALEIGSYNMYKHLLDVFIPATYCKINNFSLTYKSEKALDLMGMNAPTQKDNLNKAYHRVIDFITGMTDSYATFISRQFSGTGEGV